MFRVHQEDGSDGLANRRAGAIATATATDAAASSDDDDDDDDLDGIRITTFNWIMTRQRAVA